ncbi:35772_t:CDS:1, partial [Racocetra persica]
IVLIFSWVCHHSLCGVFGIIIFGILILEAVVRIIAIDIC